MEIKQRALLLSCAILVFLITWPESSRGQNNPAQPEKLSPKIPAFFKKMEPKVRFRGEVISIPEDLRRSLEVTFYLHRFTIVGLERSLDISYMRNEMIIVTDAKSGDVVASMWQLTYGHASPEFKEILSHYPEQHDWRYTAGRIKLFADLLVYPDRKYERFITSRVGSIRYYPKEKAITVELIIRYAPHVLLRIQVEEVDDRYKLGRLSFIDPETGKER